MVVVERAVTIAGPDCAIDVRVPAGVPVADLLPQLARAVGVPRGESGWELVPVGGQPLLPATTLAAADVSDGDVLHLRAPVPTGPPADVRSVRDRVGPPPSSAGVAGSSQWSALVSAAMTVALGLPLVAAALFGLLVPVRGTPLASPSVAFVLGAVLLALLGGWAAVRDSPGRTAPGATSARSVRSTAAGVFAIAWAAVAGGGLVLMTVPPPASASLVAGGGGVVAALVATVLGGWWAARRGSDARGKALIACGGYGLLALGAAAVLAGAVGQDVAARLIAVAAALSVGVLPAVAVAVSGTSRVDRVAGGPGVPAAAADLVAARSAAVLRGALGGAALVATLAVACRWPQAGPADLATATVAALLFALRARTVGERFSGLPMAGAAATAVLAIGMTVGGAPADRLLVTLAAAVAVLGVIRVWLDHRRPSSPAAAAHSTRVARWSERVLVVLAIPLAGGAVDGVSALWTSR